MNTTKKMPQQDRKIFDADLDKIDQKYKKFFETNPSGLIDSSGLPEQDCIRNYIIETFTSGRGESTIHTDRVSSLPPEIQEDFLYVLKKHFPEAPKDYWYRLNS